MALRQLICFDFTKHVPKNLILMIFFKEDVNFLKKS